ncbi:MAG: NCS2 family permease [Magnetospirillum sp.]|nr:NCS2 family permease [Magnetospirillum sp.]
MLERLFRLKANGTTAGTEVLAGATTFLTMAYIIFINPAILADAGMDHGAVFVATCLVSALACLLMGVWANYPVALAPGMGLNAYFAYSVVQGMGTSWQIALGAVFLSGCLFVLISLSRIRDAIVDAIPHSMKLAISAGIGLFLGIIALKNAGLIVAHPATLLTAGDITRPTALLAVGGFLAMVALDTRKVPGSIMIAVLGTTALGMALGVTPFAGVVAPPPPLLPTFAQMDLAGAVHLGLLTIVFAFLFVDLFDNTGTLIGLAHRARLLDAKERLPRLRPAMLSNGLANMASGVLGTSPVTSYIESAAGIKAGGRTGLTSVVVALLFLLALAFSPLAASVPPYATAPALLFVACLLARGLTEIAWDDLTEAVPAVVTAITMPLTFSIAHGISFGFITYVGVKLLTGRVRDITPTAAALAMAFGVKYWWLG